LLQRLAMLRNIEALQLLLHRKADRDKEATQLEKVTITDQPSVTATPWSWASNRCGLPSRRPEVSSP
jgi:hypothetical protein